MRKRIISYQIEKIILSTVGLRIKEALKMQYGYARVSTKEQNEGRQLAALTEFGVSEKCIYISTSNPGKTSKGITTKNCLKK